VRPRCAEGRAVDLRFGLVGGVGEVGETVVPPGGGRSDPI
jgi:hypothetical protein